jgi:hypothetical protein
MGPKQPRDGRNGQTPARREADEVVDAMLDRTARHISSAIPYMIAGLALAGVAFLLVKWLNIG